MIKQPTGDLSKYYEKNKTIDAIEIEQYEFSYGQCNSAHMELLRQKLQLMSSINTSPEDFNKFMNQIQVSNKDVDNYLERVGMCSTCSTKIVNKHFYRHITCYEHNAISSYRKLVLLNMQYRYLLQIAISKIKDTQKTNNVEDIHAKLEQLVTMLTISNNSIGVVDSDGINAENYQDGNVCIPDVINNNEQLLSTTNNNSMGVVDSDDINAENRSTDSSSSVSVIEETWVPSTYEAIENDIEKIIHFRCGDQNKTLRCQVPDTIIINEVRTQLQCKDLRLRIANELNKRIELTNEYGYDTLNFQFDSRPSTCRNGIFWSSNYTVDYRHMAGYTCLLSLYGQTIYSASNDEKQALRKYLNVKVFKNPKSKWMDNLLLFIEQNRTEEDSKKKKVTLSIRRNEFYTNLVIDWVKVLIAWSNKDGIGLKRLTLIHTFLSNGNDMQNYNLQLTGKVIRSIDFKKSPILFRFVIVVSRSKLQPYYFLDYSMFTPGKRPESLCSFDTIMNTNMLLCPNVMLKREGHPFFQYEHLNKLDNEMKDIFQAQFKICVERLTKRYASTCIKWVVNNATTASYINVSSVV